MLHWLKSVLKMNHNLLDGRAPPERDLAKAELNEAMAKLEDAARRAGLSEEELYEAKREARRIVDPLRAFADSVHRQSNKVQRQREEGK